MVSSVDMALSDIIKTKNSAKKFVKKSPAGVRKQGSFKGRRSSNGPSNNTPRRQSGGVRKPFAVVNSNDKRNVRINVSNLASSVISSDLKELFGEFGLRSVVVNFDEQGAPLGTGDLSLSKANADRLIQQYTGVVLDGKPLKFALIDSNIAARTTFPAQKVQGRRSTGFGGKQSNKTSPKKTVGGHKKAGGLKKKRDEKPKKTTEELDAELDAYMSRGVVAMESE